MSALTEIAESMLKLMEVGGAKDLPVIDMMVEWIRTGFNGGYQSFQDRVDRLFAAAVDSPAKRKQLTKRFYMENRFRIAELVLTEKRV